MKIALFIILFFVGFGLAFTILFAPVHEEGHVGGYIASDVFSFVAGYDYTLSERYTKSGLMGGYLSEFVTFGIFTIILFFIFKKAYFMCAFTFGYCNGIIIAPAVGSDFYRVPEWTAGMWQDWLIVTIPMLIIAWLVVIFYRFVREIEYRNANKDKYHGKDKHPYIK